MQDRMQENYLRLPQLCAKLGGIGMRLLRKWLKELTWPWNGAGSGG